MLKGRKEAGMYQIRWWFTFFGDLICVSDTQNKNHNFIILKNVYICLNSTLMMIIWIIITIYIYNKLLLLFEKSMYWMKHILDEYQNVQC